METEQLPVASTARRLVGRSAEMHRLGVSLTHAVGGRSQAWLIPGDSGIGKTALLRALGRAAHEAGFVVCEVAGVEFGADATAEHLAELLDPLLAHPDAEPHLVRGLESALGDSRTDLAGPLVRRLAGQLLTGVAGHQPVAVLIDDVHWLDPPLVAMVGSWMSRLEVDHVFAAVAIRSGETSPIERLALPQLPLKGLPLREVLGLIPELRSVARSVGERLAGETGGNPLAVLELIAALTDDQLAGTEPLPEVLPIGRRTSEVFLRRLGLLSDDARRVAAAAAAEKGADVVVVREVAAVIGCPPEAFEECENAGLIEVHAGRYSWSHPLARSAAYHGLAAADRRAVHRALAAVHDGRHHPVIVATHLAAGTEAPDAHVSRRITHGAELLAQRGSLSAAATLFEQAAGLAVETSSRTELLTRSGECLLRSGRLGGAARVLGEALAGAPPGAARNRIVARLGETELWRLGTRHGAAILTDAAEQLGPADPDRVELFSLAALAMMQAGDVCRQEELTSVVRGLEDGVDPHVARTRDVLLGSALVHLGRAEEGHALLDPLRSGVAHAISIGTHGADHLAYALAWADLTCERHREVEASLRSLRAAGLEFGFSTGFADVMLGEVLWRTGRWSESWSILGGAVDQAVAEESEFLEWLARACRARNDAAFGRLEAADDEAQLALERAVEFQSSVVTAWAGAALGLSALAAGNPHEAARQLTALRDETRRLGTEHPGAMWWEGDLIEALVAIGELHEARDEIQVLARQAQRTGNRWGEAVALRSQALLDRDPSTLERAERLFLALPAPFEYARCELLRGEIMQEAGSLSSDAGAALAHQTAIRFDRLGARPWAARARRLVERVTDPRRATVAPRSVLALSLSRSELDVALLVGAGLKSREAAERLQISPKTVEYHLNSIYRKLDVRNRVELARLIALETRSL